MINISVRPVGDYVEVMVEGDNFSYKNGLSDEVEAEAIARHLIWAVQDLLNFTDHKNEYGMLERVLEQMS